MTDLSGHCPICDTKIKFDKNVEESEIVNCPDCKSRVVVTKIQDNKVQLNEAPQIEEDWGE